MEKVRLKLSELIAPKYKQFVLDNVTSHWLLWGGRISAKGDAAYTKAVRLALSQKGAIYVYVPIQGTIHDGVFQQIQKVLIRMQVPYECSKSRHTITVTATGTIFKCKGMAIENAKKTTEAFKGTTDKEKVLMVIFDELASAGDDSRVRTIINTHSRESGCLFTYIFNPPRDPTSWLFDLIDSFTHTEEPERYKSVKTTVYDLPSHWESAKAGIIEANSLKLQSESKWRFEFLGEPGFNNTDTFPDLKDAIVDTEYIQNIMNNTGFKNFHVFTDNGNVDATTFTLFGETYDRKIIALKNFYHSGRETLQYKAFSVYAKELYDWLRDSGMPETYDKRGGRQITTSVQTDSLNFALECQKVGLPNTHNTTIKNSALSYILLREGIRDGKILIYDCIANEMLIAQMKNARVDESIVKGKPVYKIHRPNNNNTPEKKQVHCVDTMTYMAIKLAGILLLRRGEPNVRPNN